jgi:hypothetical protein
MDKQDVVTSLGDHWELEHMQSEVTDDMPPPLRGAGPTRYRLAFRG